MDDSHYPHLLFQQNWSFSEDTSVRLGQCAGMIQSILRLPLLPEVKQELKLVSMIKGAAATTRIEGNTLSDEEAEKTARGLELEPSKQYQQQELRNVMDAMNQLFDELANSPRRMLISPEFILRVHGLVGKDLGELFDAIPGRYRQDSRAVNRYRCPDYRDVPQLMSQLCDWLKSFGYVQGNQSLHSAIIQAIVAHVYLEWIHPFGDGNGRTGRLIEFYILCRAGVPDICSHVLANHYNNTRPEYYGHFDIARRERSLTKFIAYSVLGLRDGLLNVVETVQDCQLTVAWEHFVYAKFKSRPLKNRERFHRLRTLALKIPPDDFEADDALRLSKELFDLYRDKHSRTIKRDLGELKSMEIVGEMDGKFYARKDQLVLSTRAASAGQVLLG